METEMETDIGRSEIARWAGGLVRQVCFLFRSVLASKYIRGAGGRHRDVGM